MRQSALRLGCWLRAAAQTRPAGHAGWPGNARCSATCSGSDETDRGHGTFVRVDVPLFLCFAWRKKKKKKEQPRSVNERENNHQHGTTSFSVCCFKHLFSAPAFTSLHFPTQNSRNSASSTSSTSTAPVKRDSAPSAVRHSSAAISRALSSFSSSCQHRPRPPVRQKGPRHANRCPRRSIVTVPASTTVPLVWPARRLSGQSQLNSCKGF